MHPAAGLTVFEYGGWGGNSLSTLTREQLAQLTRFSLVFERVLVTA